eukprot:CAMPEP_0181021996 /NCGR_PEP_ID=MMETSP1070-20121207/1281_1 /TAXON_ID=265543 /ORGANISM="Minutocellus polymorphus, Strain NH13" /LENGTH=45 /DNA_ID= /DNA_START= /DNA_END= /DNA_ORIENTATION=
MATTVIVVSGTRVNNISPDNNLFSYMASAKSNEYNTSSKNVAIAL